MTPQQQKQLVRALTSVIADNICKKIDTGKVPPSWDHHEMRSWIFDIACHFLSLSEIARDGRCKRARAFKRICDANNL